MIFSDGTLNQGIPRKDAVPCSGFSDNVFFHWATRRILYIVKNGYFLSDNPHSQPVEGKNAAIDVHFIKVSSKLKSQFDGARDY